MRTEAGCGMGDKSGSACHGRLTAAISSFFAIALAYKWSSLQLDLSEITLKDSTQ